jgi:Fe-S-cluster-containing dehydrogenase component
MQYGGGSWALKDGVPVPEGVFTYSVSVSCMNCARPPCAGCVPRSNGQRLRSMLIDAEVRRLPQV